MSRVRGSGMERDRAGTGAAADRVLPADQLRASADRSDPAVHRQGCLGSGPGRHLRVSAIAASAAAGRQHSPPPVGPGWKFHGRVHFAVQQDAMSVSLADLLPDASWDPSSDVLLDRFLQYAAGRNLSLYPAQEEAILELLDGKKVILNTPTGSGKSLVASAMLFASLARGQRAVYTCPIKALVNERWMGLCREFGPDQVGLSTGDATVNRDAPILCCTAEVLANIALREGPEAAIDEVVMDEFHYYADRDRGVAWQVPLLTMPQARFLLMSATLGDTTFFEKELTRLNGRETA